MIEPSVDGSAAIDGIVYGCDRCRGSGLEPGSYDRPYKHCKRCYGSGYDPAVYPLRVQKFIEDTARKIT